MTPLQLALKVRDNFSAKLLITGGSQAYFPEVDRAHQSPIFYLIKTQNVVILEALNNKDAELLHRVRTPENCTLI